MDLFTDSDVQKARDCRGCIDLAGGGRILLPRVFGFCAGVVRALQLLSHTLTPEPRGRTILLGPIIHNDTVNDAFRRQGVQVLPEDSITRIFEVARPGDTVVIPAFGVPADLEQRLHNELSDCRILDTTCNDVRASWQFIAAGQPGGIVVVHGKPDHPETRATLSRALAIASRTIIIASPEEAPSLCRCLTTGQWEGFASGRVFEGGGVTECRRSLTVVNQTTMLHEETLAIGDRIGAWAQREGFECRVADSVCQATQRRQDAARAVCACKPDCVLVVGGFSSSNTAQLYRLAQAACPTYFIGSATAIRPRTISHYVPGEGMACTTDWWPSRRPVIGILAGASCPAYDVGCVIRALRDVLDKTQDGEERNGGSDET